MFAASSFWGHKQGNTGKDPLVGISVLGLHLQVGSKHNGGTTSGCCVNWALVEALCLGLSTGHCSHVHNRHNGMQVLKLHLSQVALFAAATKFPTSTFKEETVDVGTSLSEFWVLSLVLGVEDLGLQAHVIEG